LNVGFFCRQDQRRLQLSHTARISLPLLCCAVPRRRGPGRAGSRGLCTGGAGQAAPGSLLGWGNSKARSCRTPSSSSLSTESEPRATARSADRRPSGAGREPEETDRVEEIPAPSWRGTDPAPPAWRCPGAPPQQASQEPEPPWVRLPTRPGATEKAGCSQARQRPGITPTCPSPARRSRPVLKRFAELHGRHTASTVS